MSSSHGVPGFDRRDYTIPSLGSATLVYRCIAAVLEFSCEHLFPTAWCDVIQYDDMIINSFCSNTFTFLASNPSNHLIPYAHFTITMTWNNSQRIPVPITIPARPTPTESRRLRDPSTSPRRAWILNSWGTRNSPKSTTREEDPRTKFRWIRLN